MFATGLLVTIGIFSSAVLADAIHSGAAAESRAASEGRRVKEIRCYEFEDQNNSLSKIGFLDLSNVAIAGGKVANQSKAKLKLVVYSLAAAELAP